MDGTTKELIILYTNIYNSELMSYISKYHSNLLSRWVSMLNQGNAESNEYKSIRNDLYSILLLLSTSYTSRTNFLEYCIETVRTHGDKSINSQYDSLRSIIDSVNNFDIIGQYDYNTITGIFMDFYNSNNIKDSHLISRNIASILIRYDPGNRYLNSFFSTPKDVNLEDVLSSVYGI